MSSADSYSHYTIPARDTAGTGMATPDATTPTAAAQRLLAALDPGTVANNVEVAGVRVRCTSQMYFALVNALGTFELNIAVVARPSES